MKTDSTTTLTVRINGTIETPPASNRENFRQSVIETILHVLKTQDIDVEYIGYKPDNLGIQHFDSRTADYEDCIYASLSVSDNILSQFGLGHREDDIISAFVEAFEATTPDTCISIIS
ncbi:MAG: hypothetical protein EOO96_21700 [Pedobacter sp.]|nr:MAG: hypothetical protein EOO96_21700 [Pedobacter sp.]